MTAHLGRPQRPGPAERAGAATPGDAGGSPFRAEGRRERVAPFAAMAVAAEASLALPPGPQSVPGVVVSLVLLGAAAGAFALRWERLPGWATVLVPLAYTGSVLALVLATGQSASGIGIVVLVPILWTALFHRRWESICVVGAVVVVEIVSALVPGGVSDSVLARRVVFWAVLGLLVVLAVHGLRDRATRAQGDAEEAHAQLRRFALLDDRERIARRLYESTIHRLVGVGFHLEATSSLAGRPEVRQRIDQAVGELDETVRRLRAEIFDLDPRPADAVADAARTLGAGGTAGDGSGAGGPVPDLADA